VDTFGDLYAQDDLAQFLDGNKTAEAFTRTLSDGRHIFRVAERDGEMVAYCKLGLESTFEDMPADWAGGIELKELYLDGTVQGAGVGQTLMDWALTEAKARQAPAIVLSVWSENFRAQRFYQRYGFAHIADTYFMVGNHRDDEFLYGLKLD
jgi:diamine N-acetyltransferase